MRKKTHAPRLAEPPPLWTCPKCEHQFVTKNLSHSCVRHRIDDHFEGCDPIVRIVFDRLVALFEAFGPLTVYAQKSRIVCQVRVRFAAVTTRKHALDGHLWLKRRADHPAIYRVDLLPPGNYVHKFRLSALDQFDDAAFRRLAGEAYAVGEQRHLLARRRPPARTRV